jgi:SAM-dependent methyltransferase
MAEPTAEATQAFAQQLLAIFTGSALSKLIRLGYETGLLEALADTPLTSNELAGALNLDERYVREWLGAMATGGILEYDLEEARFVLLSEHAALLTGSTSRNLAPMSKMVENFGLQLEAIEDCFHRGGGVPYSAYRPDFTEAMDDLWRRIYDEQLIDGFLAAAPEVVKCLQDGSSAADIGCGTGHALNLMALAFPASQFVGYEIADDAVEIARAEAERMVLDNVSFEVLDVTKLPSAPAFDVIFAFDAIHDQVDPAGVLDRIYDALADDGIFYMMDMKFASEVGGNLDNPFAPLYYGISLMHCMTVSLAEGGAGLGTVWGITKAKEMLGRAGFTDVAVLDSPRPQNCIYLCRK